MSKRTFVISILLALAITFAIVGFYNTYAAYVEYDDSDESFSIVDNSEDVSLESGQEKTIVYQIKNDNNGTVAYAVGRSYNANVIIKVYEDSYDPVSGFINKGENKFVKLHLKNIGQQTNVIITTVLGYENGGNLVVPGGVTLVTETYLYGMAGYINELFSPTGTVTNNSLTYSIDANNSLIKDQSGNIRYYGASPDNYIYFNCEAYPNTNCELWRIIGVIDGKLKIMRNSSIGRYSWDTSASTINSGYGINEWSQADVMKLLNPGYENNQDLNNSGDTITVNNSLYYNSGSGTCYTGAKNASASCNFTSTGIKNDITRNNIIEANYHTAGYSSGAIYPNQMLTYEHGTLVGDNTNDGVIRNTEWSSKIVIPYPSDYGYAADLSICSDKKLNQYNDANCTANNWMTTMIMGNSASTSLMSPYTASGSSNRAYGVTYSSGLVTANYYTYNKFNVYPALYISSNFEFCGGSGESEDPWLICF